MRATLPTAYPTLEMQLHVRRLKQSGATLIVVAIGAKAFGAADADPFAALRMAARKASTDLGGAGRASTRR